MHAISWNIQYFDADNKPLLESYQKVKIDSRPNCNIEESFIGEYDIWLPTRSNWNPIIVEHGSQINLNNISKAKMILVESTEDEVILETWDINVDDSTCEENKITLKVQSVNRQSSITTL